MLGSQHLCAGLLQGADITCGLPALQKLHETQCSRAWPDTRCNDSDWLPQEAAVGGAEAVAAAGHIHPALQIG